MISRCFSDCRLPLSVASRRLGDATTSEQEIALLDREELTGQPGSRVPHLWLEQHGKRISTLELVDGHFVLLTGDGGMAWREAASAAAADLGVGLSAYVIGTDGDLVDLEHQWPEKCGVETSGALLVRPDGFVAWRSPNVSSTATPLLERALGDALCLAR
jgi:putative polyketide hydroxylase